MKQWVWSFFEILFIFFIKSSLAPCVLESILKAGWNFWDFHFLYLKLRENIGLEIGYVHGSRGPESQIDLNKASLAHPT